MDSEGYSEGMLGKDCITFSCSFLIRIKGSPSQLTSFTLLHTPLPAVQMNTLNVEPLCCAT